MSCNSEIHENDVGTEFICTVVQCVVGVETPLDISSAISKDIIFKRSDGTILTKSAIFTPIPSGGTGTGSDGKISYFTVVGDLSPVGTYKLQGVVTTPEGRWSSTIDKFKVVSNLS